jgi:predicted transcriptional regulator of viral defense system
MSPTARHYVDDLLARGRHTFTREEAESALGASSEAAYLALRRLVKRGRLAMPRRGFYLIIEPQHRALGALPPAVWIDDLMRFHAAPYYVGLLSAAALHGAAHQQPQEFQVVAAKVLRRVTVGRVRIRFFHREQMRRATTEQMKTPSGTIPVSTPEMTAWDLVRYRSAASIDHVATVIAELGERMDAARLVAVAKRNDELSLVQRLGYLLEHTGHAALADALAKLTTTRRLRTVPLEPGSPEPCVARDARWHVLVNATVEAET